MAIRKRVAKRLIACRFVPLVITAGVLPSGTTGLQQAIEIPPKVACSACRIEAHQVALLRDSENQPSVGERLSITQNSRGVFYGVDWQFDPWLIRVFDRNGKLSRKIGRQGSGPGEYRRLRPPLYGGGDTMFVLDVSTRRMSTLTPDGRYLNSIPFVGEPSPHGVLVVPSGFIVSANLGSPETVGWPLHFINRRGGVQRSFGIDVPVLIPGQPYTSRRVIARSGLHHLWSSRVNSYVIERWTLDGKKTQTLLRKTDWFAPWTNYEGPRSVVAPPPFITAIWEDTRGYVWVVLHVRDANWRRTNMKAKPGDMIMMRRAENDQFVDTLIEVIDPVKRQLITSARFPQQFSSGGNGQPLMSYAEDNDGRPIYRAWRFTLEGGAK